MSETIHCPVCGQEGTITGGDNDLVVASCGHSFSVSDWREEQDRMLAEERPDTCIDHEEG